MLRRRRSSAVYAKIIVVPPPITPNPSPNQKIGVLKAWDNLTENRAYEFLARVAMHTAPAVLLPNGCFRADSWTGVIGVVTCSIAGCLQRKGSNFRAVDPTAQSSENVAARRLSISSTFVTSKKPCRLYAAARRASKFEAHGPCHLAQMGP